MSPNSPSSIEGLPSSVVISTDVIENYDFGSDGSDASSELSDPPSSINMTGDNLMDDNPNDMGHMEIDDGDYGISSPESSEVDIRPISRKRKASPSPSSLDLAPDFVNEFDDINVNGIRPSPRKCQVFEPSPFESAPRELIQRIASNLDSDGDFHSLALTCKALAAIVMPENSGVWRTRFLARYDHPFTSTPPQAHEYCVAYRLRRFVLRTITGFGTGGDRITDGKARIQLEVLRDMVLETYHKQAPHHQAPTHSRNLAAFLLPDESPWMRAFLNSPLYAHASYLPHGIPHPLFDALQVCLSHLLLNVVSPMARDVTSDRGNYDLQRVYNWNQPFATLYMRLPNDEPEPEFRSLLFPNLPSPSLGVKCQYNLNMHTLLHIRNFWHHHFVDEPKSAYSIAPREGTYADMAKTLASHGITVKSWDGPIQQPEVGEFQGKWTGHYSCLHLWPKKTEELEEEQSFAVNWATVDPLTLECATSTNNGISGHWPAIFSTMPAFASTIPALEPHLDKTTDNNNSFSTDPSPFKYIRGLAPFLDLGELVRKPTPQPQAGTTSSETKPKHKLKTKGGSRGKAKNKRVHDDLTNDDVLSLSDSSSSPSTSSTPIITSSSSSKHPQTSSSHGPTKYHPYLSLRLRGIVHPISAAETAGIPGWQRLIMVMYKPTSRYLIQVLEYANEEFGDPFMQQLGPGNGPTAVGQGPAQVLLTPEQMEISLKAILARKISEFEQLWRKENAATAASSSSNHKSGEPDSATTPWTSQRIAGLEDAFYKPMHLDWADVEYAYAYEGVVVPGGKVMLGRWWRCASVAGGGVGEGGGMEVVEDANVVGDEEAGIPAGGWRRERGPWVFWC